MLVATSKTAYPLCNQKIKLRLQLNNLTQNPDFGVSQFGKEEGTTRRLNLP